MAMHRSSLSSSTLNWMLSLADVTGSTDTTSGGPGGFGADEVFERMSDWEIDMSWIDDAVAVLDYYTERTPGSIIEFKDSCVAWHYRDCDVSHGNWQAKQCAMQLVELAKRVPLEVCVGDKLIEVRPSGNPAPNLLDCVINKFDLQVNQATRRLEQQLERQRREETTAAARRAQHYFETLQTRPTPPVAAPTSPRRARAAAAPAARDRNRNRNRARGGQGGPGG